MSTSWQRSIDQHRVDPGSNRAPWILTAQELRVSRAPVEELLTIAREENERLYGAVGKVGYAVLFTSADGVVVHALGDPGQKAEFVRWGIWQGGVWSERAEGTNGIGTCIVERRPITIHRSQHFRARHANLSCCSVPIFDPNGKLSAVLDVSSYNPELSDRSHALALALTIDSAHAVEERQFRQAFHGAWICAVTIPSANQPIFLLAVDDEHRIQGADQHARSILGLDSAALAAGISLWNFFDQSSDFFRPERGDTAVELTRLGDPEPWRAVLTPPEKRLSPGYAPFHTRPRIPGGNLNLHPNERSVLRTPEPGNPAPGTVALSPREHSILEHVGQGRSNKEIARELGISPETVKSHLNHVFVKLDVERRAQAIYRAKELGLLS